MAASRGTGLMRERRPGVWEIRVAAGTDVVTGRTVQRSVMLHGSASDAEVYRAQLAAEYAGRGRGHGVFYLRFDEVGVDGDGGGRSRAGCCDHLGARIDDVSGRPHSGNAGPAGCVDRDELRRIDVASKTNEQTVVM